MPTTGTQVVIFNADRTQTLLIKREDFRVWTVPGGRVEPGESVEEAVIREAFEETGHPVAIDCFLGEYWRPQLRNGGSLVYGYIGHVTTGEHGTPDWEAAAVAWVAVDSLPRRTLAFVREMIHDARFVTDLPVKRTLLLPRWQQMMIAIGVPVRNWRNWWLGRWSPFAIGVADNLIAAYVDSEPMERKDNHYGTTNSRAVYHRDPCRGRDPVWCYSGRPPRIGWRRELHL